MKQLERPRFHSRFQFVTGLLILLGATAGSFAKAAAQNTAASAVDATTALEQSAVVARVYNVTDLVERGMPSVPFSNVPLGDLDNPPEIPSAQEMADRRAETVQKICNRLYDAVPANSWKGRGGHGTISQIPGQGQLIIIQTIPNQEKIASALSKLRHAANRQVNIEARFITLTNNAKLLPGKATTNGNGPIYLNDQEVKTLLATINHDKANVVLAPRVSIFDHQDAYIAAVTQTAYINSVVDISKKGNPQYRPHKSIVKTGSQLEVRGDIALDQKSIAVSFRARDQRLVKMEDHPWTRDPQLHIQQPVLDVHQSQMDINIPNSKTLVVRLRDTGTKSPGRSVWLLIRPQIFEMTETQISPTERMQYWHG